MKKTGIPIFFIQVGDFYNISAKKYLDIAILQASLASPNSPIILISDTERIVPEGVIQVNIKKYESAEIKKFKKLYINLSVNRNDYEIFCFLRWFYIKNYVEEQKIDYFCVFDSDILLFSPVEVFAAEFAGYKAGNWVWANYFSDISVLNDFCNHILSIYNRKNIEQFINEKYKLYNQGKKIQVSDMIVLFEFCKENPVFIDFNSKIEKGYDNNINNIGDRLFIYDDHVKRLTIGKGGIPTGYRTRDGAEVPFHFLHFQGPAKQLMEHYAWKLPEPAPPSRPLSFFQRFLGR